MSIPAAPGTTGVRQARRTFWLGVLGYVVLMAVMSSMVRSALIRELEEHSEQANRQFTRMFANDNWERLRPLLRLGATPEEAKSNASLDEITSIVRRFSRGTELVAVKIFNAQGLLLYATDGSQIGADRSRSPGFLMAVRGEVATELIHRDKVSGFDGDIHNRDLVASYVPIRQESAVEAVVEVYTDRTVALQAANETSLRIVGLLVLLGALALVPWLRLTLRLERARQAAEEARLGLAQARDADRERFRQEVAARDRFLERLTRHLEEPAGEALRALQALPGSGQSQASPGQVAPQESDASAARAGVETLARRVAALREVVQLESGRCPLEQRGVHLGGLIREAARRVQDEAKAAGVQARVHIAASCEGQVQTDPVVLHRVLDLLLDLAWRRTGADGSIHLRVQAEASGVVVDVMDTGEALPPGLVAQHGGGQMPAAPESPQPGPELTEPDVEIGWRRVAGLVKALEGRLTVHSSAGRGTSVQLWLPIRIESPPSPPSSPSPAMAGGPPAHGGPSA